MKRILSVSDDDLYNKNVFCKVKNCSYFLCTQNHFKTFFEISTNIRKCSIFHYSVRMPEYFDQMKFPLCEKCRNVSHTHSRRYYAGTHTYTYIHVYVYIHIKKAMWIVLEKIVLIKNNAYLLIINFLLLYKKLNLPLLKLVQMWQHLSFFAQPLPFSHRLYNPLLILQFQRRTSLVLQGPIKLKRHNFLNFFL